jgi:hypothetical protein
MLDSIMSIHDDLRLLIKAMPIDKDPSGYVVPMEYPEKNIYNGTTLHIEQ